MSVNLGGRFGYFYVLLGGGEGVIREGSFLLKSPGVGGGVSQEPGGCPQEIWGERGAKYFFAGPKFPPSNCLLS